MPKCDFCKGEMPKGKGKTFVKSSGQILLFCNSKCEKNWKMKRVGKKVKWTKFYANEKGK